MTITASSNLSEDEIKRAVNEAEQFAAEDKKQKEIQGQRLRQHELAAERLGVTLSAGRSGVEGFFSDDAQTLRVFSE